jgi:NitT/TauT family transport system substrate-binding protein
MPSRARTRNRRPRRVGAVVAALAVLTTVGGCGGSDGGEDVATGPAADAVSDVIGPIVPDSPGEGCGRLARTDPVDTEAGRVLARCGAGAPEPAPLAAPATVRVAVPVAVTAELAPLLVADALGEFAAEGLTVEQVPLGPADAVAALEAGEVDVVTGTINGPYFDALNRGSASRLVLGGVLSPAPNAHEVGQTGLWVREDALDEDGLSDLRLQPVGVPGGVRSGITYALGLTLGQTEITLNDVALTDIAGGEAAQVLMAGELAAAWLDGGAWEPLAGTPGYRLAATLPASESVDGTIVSERLLGPDRAVGRAYVRALVRTVNTHLTGDYRDDDAVMTALAEATGVPADLLGELPALLFDWEVRDGTPRRIEEALRALGGVGYDIPLDPEVLVDRTLVAEVLGDEAPPSAQAP